MFGAATALAVAHLWPVWPAVIVNAVGMYLLFTVAHEASYGSISTRRWVNDAMGRIAMPFFAPFAGLQTWRWLHMQHHNHPNDPVLDPDARINNGRGPALLRWLVGDAYALRYYARAFPKRPRKEKLEFALSVVVGGTAAALSIASGHLADYLLLYLLANRLHFVYLVALTSLVMCLIVVRLIASTAAVPEAALEQERPARAHDRMLSNV